MTSSAPKETLLKRTGDLYELLMAYFPDHRSKQKVLDIPGLARDMGFAHETLYRCLRRNHMKIPVALTILKFSDENHPEMPLYWDDLLPFVLPSWQKYRDPSKH